MDSGAARSVCPRKFGEKFGLAATAESRRGDTFLTATGKPVANLGGRTVAGVTASGKNISMRYAVADVAVALDSVSQICDSGASVHFDKFGGWIEDAAGMITPFERRGDTYVRSTWMHGLTGKTENWTEPSPFGGQRP